MNGNKDELAKIVTPLKEIGNIGPVHKKARINETEGKINCLVSIEIVIIIRIIIIMIK